MKFIERYKASKLYAEIGEEYEREVKYLQDAEGKLKKTLQSGTCRPIQVGVSDMPDINLFFYELSGEQILDGLGVAQINATAVDNGWNVNCHHHTTHLLVKDYMKSQVPPTVDNTRVYKIVYYEAENNKPAHYDISYLAPNENEATSEIFPTIIRKIEVGPKGYNRSDISQYPINDKKTAPSLTDFHRISQVSGYYEKSILPQIKKFIKQPTKTHSIEFDGSMGM